MTDSIIVSSSEYNKDFVTLVESDNRDIDYRIRQYETWMNETGRVWWQPELEAYQHYLREEHTYSDHRGGIKHLSPITIKNYLSTIRSRYNQLLKNNQMIEWLKEGFRRQGYHSPADQEAHLQAFVRRIQNEIDSQNINKIKVINKQDEADGDHLRLTVVQANTLIQKPGLKTLKGCRDTTVIAMLLCTGIRESELCSLNVVDLRQELGGHLAVAIRNGKRAKQRLVPYGDMDWVLIVIDHWRNLAGIDQGPVFRGLWSSGKTVRPTRLTRWTINNILASYPISIDGELKAVTPHDCRRTYARRLWDAGMPVKAIKDNMGHDSIKTTMHYIGALDGKARAPQSIFAPPPGL